MLDFTSALYLGLSHPSRLLRQWGSLSLGRPAALGEPPGSAEVAADLAGLIGCEAGILLPSTLHLFLDLFGVLARERIAIYMDQGSYPIVKWGAQRAAALGVPLRGFNRHDVDGLRRLILLDRGRRPVIVADGFCLDCGMAPVKAYAQLASDHGGYVVLDDTQALGIMGSAPSRDNIYGYGGGGALRWHGVTAPQLIVGSSLAKGFGVPVAVLAGSGSLIRRFREQSDTRVHCSPPSVAVIEAARHALMINRASGEVLRTRLRQHVAAFRKILKQAALTAAGGLFPVQTLQTPPGLSVQRLHQRLRDQGIHTVLRSSCDSRQPLLSFVISAAHSPSEVRTAALAAGRLAAGLGRLTTGGIHEHV